MENCKEEMTMLNSTRKKKKEQISLNQRVQQKVYQCRQLKNKAIFAALNTEHRKYSVTPRKFLSPEKDSL